MPNTPPLPDPTPLPPAPHARPNVGCAVRTILIVDRPPTLIVLILLIVLIVF